MENKITKTFSNDKVSLERHYITKTVKLELSPDKCFGCGACTEVCPKEALKLSKAIHKDGRLIQRPTLNMEPEKCVLCGTCVVFCPSHALKMKVNGADNISVLTYDIQPQPVRKVTVNHQKCIKDCQLACQEACPNQSITVVTENENIKNVKVNEETCFYCKQCESACPYELIEVENPYEGTLIIDTSRCPEGCKICVDACPSHAMTVTEEGKPESNMDFCILCSACVNVCPQNAISLERTLVKVSDTRSGAWFNALERLTSPEIKAKEIAKDAAKHRKKVVKDTFPSQI